MVHQSHSAKVRVSDRMRALKRQIQDRKLTIEQMKKEEQMKRQETEKNLARTERIVEQIRRTRPELVQYFVEGSSEESHEEELGPALLLMTGHKGLGAELMGTYYWEDLELLHACCAYVEI